MAEESYDTSVRSNLRWSIALPSGAGIAIIGLVILLFMMQPWWKLKDIFGLCIIVALLVGMMLGVYLTSLGDRPRR